MSGSPNVDETTVMGFGEEWSAFNQSGTGSADFDRLFDTHFHLFRFDRLPRDSEGFDLACGSGRWALGVAPKVGKLHCNDPAEKALAVARLRPQGHANVRFHQAAADSIPLTDGSQDLGYSVGVPHHIPETARALRDAVRDAGLDDVRFNEREPYWVAVGWWAQNQS